MPFCFRKPFWLLLFFCAALTTFFPTPYALAQTDTARLSGVLSDPAGKSIPGATVTISNLATGVQRITMSNGDGIYTLPSVTPGRYRVIVQKQGFREVRLGNLTLNIQDLIEQNF